MTQIADLTQQLSQATQPQNQSLLPNDLQASSEILSTVVHILEANNITSNVRITIAGFYLLGEAGGKLPP